MLDSNTISQLQKQLPFLPGHQFDLKKVISRRVSGKSNESLDQGKR